MKIKHNPGADSPVSLVGDVGTKIVVLDTGFVYFGKLHVDGEVARITDCYNLRRFGTTSGLGQLALCGPTNDTVIDATGPVTFPTARLHHTMEVDIERWGPCMSKATNRLTKIL